MIKVSVIMPAFNAEKHIGSSIESVLCQTFSDWELIVIDDGSTDRTKEIVKDYCSKDRRIQYLWQENGKQGKARNHGISYSKGEYVAFLDADDFWLDHKLALQFDLLQKLNVDLVFSDSYIFDSLPLDKEKRMHTHEGYIKGEEGIKKMLELNRVPLSTVLLRKKALQNAGGFTESAIIPQAEDYHLWLKMLFKGFTFFGMDEILAAYREHDSSTTNQDKLARRFVIEAQYDLSIIFPEYSKIIRASMKKWFKLNHYQTDYWDKESYKSLIIKNCKYLDKEKYTTFYLFLYNIFGLKITRKILSELINE